MSAGRTLPGEDEDDALLLEVAVQRLAALVDELLPERAAGLCIGRREDAPLGRLRGGHAAGLERSMVHGCGGRGTSEEEQQRSQPHEPRQQSETRRPSLRLIQRTFSRGVLSLADSK